VTLALAVPDMTAGIEIKNGSCDLITPLLGVVCHPKARTYYNLPVCKIWQFYIQPFERYDWGSKILKCATNDHDHYLITLASAAPEVWLVPTNI